MNKGGTKFPKNAPGKDSQTDKKVTLVVRKIKTAGKNNRKPEIIKPGIAFQAKPEKAEVKKFSFLKKNTDGKERKKFFSGNIKSNAANLLPEESDAGREKAESPAGPERKKQAKPVPAEVNYEKIEKDKRLIMISGVSFFMLLISFFWLYSTKQIFQNQNLGGAETSLPDWEELTSQIGKSIEEMQAGMEEIKNFATSTEAAATSTGFLRNNGGLPENKEELSTSSKVKLSDEDIDNLKNKLEEIKAGD